MSKQQGFTLLEIILYIALLAIMLTGVTYFTLDIIYSQVKANAFREVQQNARFALQRMTYEIRKAESIASISDNTLVLNNGSDPQVTLSFTDNKITVQVNGGDIEDLTTEEVEVSGSFTDMSYTYSGAVIPMSENVKIEMDISHYNPANLPDWQVAEHYETTVELKGN